MKTSIKINLASLIVRLGLMVACAFLYAVILKDCWNWFVVPLAPTVLSPLPYPMAYGLVIVFDVIATIVGTPVEDGKAMSEFSDEHPIAAAFVKPIVKVAVILILWAFAAVAHCAIG